MDYKLSPTEMIDINTKSVDTLSDKEALQSMLNSHAESIRVISSNLTNLKNIVSKVYYHLCKNEDSRIIYAGAGTSGRIGVQDGVELYPTFGWPRFRVAFLIAGGSKALLEPVENAEDNIKAVLEGIDANPVSKKDVIIALAASGNTPYTCKVVEDSDKIGALTIGISNNPNCRLLDNSKLKICLNTGPEIVAGSTRLKAGTAQKICLNLISTLLMSKFGRVKEGQMSHMVVTNDKLRQRQAKIDKILNKKD